MSLKSVELPHKRTNNFASFLAVSGIVTIYVSSYRVLLI